MRKECSQILYGREGGADLSARRRVYTRWKVVTMIYLVVGGGVRDAKGVHLMGGGGVTMISLVVGGVSERRWGYSGHVCRK